MAAGKSRFKASGVALLAMGYLLQRLIPLLAVLIPAALGASLPSLGTIELVLASAGLAGALGPLGMDGGIVLVAGRVRRVLRITMLAVVSGIALGFIASVVAGLPTGECLIAALAGGAMSATSIVFALDRSRGAYASWLAHSAGWLLGAVAVTAILRALLVSWPVSVGAGIAVGAVPALARREAHTDSPYSGRALARIGAPFCASSAAAWVLAAADRFVVARDIGSRAVGRYAIASKLTSPIAGLTTVLALWWIAEAVRHGKSWVSEWRRVAYATLGASIVGSAIYCGALELSGLNATLKVPHADALEFLLCLASIANTAYYLSAAEFAMDKASVPLSASVIGGSVIGLISIVIGCQYAGLSGAAVGTLIGQVGAWSLCSYLRRALAHRANEDQVTQIV